MTDLFRVFVIGTSAGGVETLIRLCKLLPADLPAAVFIILHTPASGPGLLPSILERNGRLPAAYPEDGEQIAPGKIYIAPPDFHLRINKDSVALWRGPRVNMLRPAADVTFDSAAHAYGPLTTGIILSGTRSDGTAGLLSIKEHGGITIVQDPDEAVFPGMPRSAIEAMAVDHITTIEGIAEKIAELARTSPGETAINPIDPLVQPKGAVEDTMEYSKRVLKQDREKFERTDLNENTRTTLTCPECGGVVVETHQNNITRYECQIGHGFSESSYLNGQSEMVEYALWAAVRALDERTLLYERLANRAMDSGRALSSEHFRDSADEARKNAELIRKIVSKGRPSRSTALTPEDGEEA